MTDRAQTDAALEIARLSLRLAAAEAVCRALSELHPPVILTGRRADLYAAWKDIRDDNR